MIESRVLPMLLVLAAGAVACGGSPDPAVNADSPDAPASPQEPRVPRSWIGMYDPVNERSFALIHDADTWAREWTRAGQQPGELPAIDFTQESVMAVFHGFERAHHSMEATLTREDGQLVLAYELFSTSGVLSPDVHPWGFHVVPRSGEAIRIESHHVHGPSQPFVEVLGTVAG